MVAFKVLCLTILASVVAATGNNEHDKIVGGRPARPGQFPHIVSLRYRNVNFCAGAVINPRWIVTAATCVYRGPTSNPRNIHAFVGAHGLKDGEQHVIMTIVNHPQFNRRTKTNDIALLRTRNNINTLNGRVNYCRLPVIDHTETAGGKHRVFMAGWGFKRDPSQPGNNLPTVLQHLPGWTIPRKNCTNIFQKLGFRVTENQVCVVSAKRAGLCRGDIGSPLTDERGFCVGIASINVNCKTQAYPDLFTRLYPYIKFIEKVTANGQQ